MRSYNLKEKKDLPVETTINLSRLYSSQIADVVNRASVAQEIFNSIKIDTSVLSRLADISDEYSKPLNKVSKLLTSTELTNILNTYNAINSSLLEINKIDLSWVAKLSDSISVQTDLINSSFSKILSVNQQINEVFTESLFRSLPDISSFELDDSFIRIVSNSSTLLDSFVTDLNEFGDEVQNEAVGVIGLDDQYVNQSLLKLKGVIENLGIDGFWQSRKKGELKTRPESIAQSMTATNLYSILDDRFSINQQVKVGIGMVDILIDYVNKDLKMGKHLIEIKVVKSTNEFGQGVEQLFEYQMISGVANATRLIFNATDNHFDVSTRERKGFFQDDVVVNLNPVIPSEK